MFVDGQVEGFDVFQDLCGPCHVPLLAVGIEEEGEGALREGEEGEGRGGRGGEEEMEEKREEEGRRRRGTGGGEGEGRRGSASNLGTLGAKVSAAF